MQLKAIDQSRRKINLLILAYIAFVTLGMPVSLMGVAWPSLRADFSLPLDAVGLLFISSTVGYLISSTLIARLISRFGIGALLIFSSVLSAISLIGYTLAPAWSVIIALGAIGGFGGGLMDAGLNTYLAAEYNEGQMQWLHASFGVGATLSPLIMTASLALFASWRPAYIFVGILMGIMVISFILTLPAWKRPEQLSTEAAEREGAERGLMDYRTSFWVTLLRVVTWLSILMFLLYTGAEYTFGNWTYTLLTEGRGVSPQFAGLWAAGYWATFTAGRVIAGIFAYRIRLTTLILGGMALSLVGAVLFWWNPLELVSILGIFIVGFAMAPIFPGLVSSTSDRVGARYAANTIGIQFGAAAIGSALIPSLAGTLAQRISLETIPMLLSVSLFGLLILYLLSTRVKMTEY
jgi:fucose permease